MNEVKYYFISAWYGMWDNNKGLYDDVGIRATGTVNENGEVIIDKVLSYDVVNESKPPKYARIGGTAMRLIDNRRYWRDAGIWGVDVRLKNGKFYASPKNGSYLEHIRGEEVKEITEAEWKDENYGYV